MLPSSVKKKSQALDLWRKGAGITIAAGQDLTQGLERRRYDAAFDRPGTISWSLDSHERLLHPREILIT